MSKIAPVSVHALEPWGRDLRRPECVVATRRGDLFVPRWPRDESAEANAHDAQPGVTVIREDGAQQEWRSASTRVRPNGIALTADGSFLVANLGTDGGIWRLTRDGTLTPFLTEVDGLTLPAANFVTTDQHDRVWMSFSTRHLPRQLAWRRDMADGFIVVHDRRGARIVADGLHYTNEVRPDPSGRFLYVVETFGRRVRRFTIAGDGSLSAPETVVTLGRGDFPDGFAFDEEGGLWITSLISNRLLRLVGDELQIVLEDINEGFVDDAERAFAAGTMHAGHLGPIPGTRLQQLTSIAFGGRDARTAFLGSLHSTCLYRFRSEVAGAFERHWEFAAP